MNILIYTHEFPPFLGGLATSSFKLATGISEAGGEVTVLAPGYSARDKELDGGFNFRIIRMGWLARNHGIPSPIKEAVGFFSLTRTLSQIEPDVVLFSTKEAQVTGGLLPSFSFKSVVRVAGSEVSSCLLKNGVGDRMLGLFIKRLYGRTSKIIAVSHSTKRLLEAAGVAEEKIEVVYNGVEMHMVHQRPNPEAIEKLRTKFNIKKGEKVILTVARLLPRKGQDMVIRALPRVTGEYPRVKYLVIGEGNYGKKFKELAEVEGIKDKVVFVGGIPHEEVVNFYDLCDVFVMPNRGWNDKVEGLPNSLLEAAARGRPVVAGAHGGSKEAVAHGKTGYLVNGESVDEVVTCILDLLRDERKARAFGIEGRRRVEEVFTEERMINGYLRVIKEA